jgi:hypothetical protein
MSKSVSQFYFLFFPTLCSNAEGFLCMHTNCVGVFREIDSVTHKKGVSMYNSVCEADAAKP